jgi:D-glycero-alpha-D-manno-heptose-7-phosphate kinase
MIIARSPVRVSFFGGGTDLAAYYTQYGGAVLNTTINKYVYVILSANRGDALQITSSDYRTFYRLGNDEPLLWEGGELSLPRAVLHHFGIHENLSMFIASEIPPGTGLGSSSAVTVALVKGVSATIGYHLTPAQVAEIACEIEIDKMGMPIGVQDQYATAFGGFNWMEFDSDNITVTPLRIPPEVIKRLEANVLLMFTGSARNSADILAKQQQSSKERKPQVIEALHSVHELARQAKKLLMDGRLDEFGRLLDEAWQHKKRFASGITNPEIDRAYALARQHGALGGKIAGAGGGGFLILYCEDGAADRVATVLEQEIVGMRRMDYHFETDGARVLFNAGLRLRFTD